MLAGTSLREESVERVITTTDRLVGWHLSVRLDAVLKAVKFPAGVTDLDTGLADVDGDTLTHIDVLRLLKVIKVLLCVEKSKEKL